MRACALARAHARTLRERWRGRRKSGEEVEASFEANVSNDVNEGGGSCSRECRREEEVVVGRVLRLCEKTFLQKQNESFDVFCDTKSRNIYNPL